MKQESSEEINHETARQKYQYFIKGSGTSGCLLTNSIEDQLQFIPLKKFYGKFQQIKIIKLTGLYAIAATTSVNEQLSSQENQDHISVWGTIDNKIYHQPFTPSFNSDVKLINMKLSVKDISCGWNHSLFSIKGRQGCLYGFGENKYGQLNKDTHQKFFSQIIQVFSLQKESEGKNEEISCFCAGFRQSYFVAEKNTFYGCGQSKNYELGVVNKKQVQKMVKIGKQQDKQFIKIECGKKYAVFLANCGSVYGIGSNDHGCLLLDGKESKYVEKITQIYPNNIEGLQFSQGITDIATGWSHTILLTKTGHIRTFGRNNFGQLGRKSDEPSQLKILRNIAKNTNEKEEQKFVRICSGTQFSFAITNQKKLFGWGWNQHMNILNIKQKQIFQRPVQIQHYMQLKKIEQCITYPAITILKVKI